MRHKIVIFAGPSGVGKATIEKELFKISELKLKFSCSATTRKPRQGEVEGKQYYFLTNEQFDAKIAANAFLEWNAHFDNRYGTLNSEIIRIINEGYIPFLEVDVDGAKTIMQKLTGKYQLITIFIMPPSIDELARRIKQRNTENDKEMKLRLERYQKEIDARKYFDHVILNQDLNKTVTKIAKIIMEA